MLKRLYVFSLLLTVPLYACDKQSSPLDPNIIPLTQAYSSVSLQELTKQLNKGMSKSDVEKVLGLPDYSPIDGLYYYSAKNAQTLVVDYRNKKDEVTKELQSFWLGKVGE